MITAQDIRKTAKTLGLSVSSSRVEEILDELENNPHANADTIVEMLKVQNSFTNGRIRAEQEIRNKIMNAGIQIQNREKFPDGMKMKYQMRPGGPTADITVVHDCVSFVTIKFSDGTTKDEKEFSRLKPA